VDTRNSDGEPIEAEKVKVGSSDMEMTSDFTASIEQQSETEYYHRYENGACYEFVLGLGTAGYGTKRKHRAGESRGSVYEAEQDFGVGEDRTDGTEADC
jgi:hypothetical protein